MSDSVTGEEAIRQVIKDGVVGDFCDVVDVVKRKFGLQVGTGQVEQVYGRIKKERADRVSGSAGGVSQTASPEVPGRPDDVGRMPPRIDRAVLELRGSMPHDDSAVPASGPPAAGTGETDGQRGRVLEFVEAMGGFDAARAAISRVEESLKQLMKKW
ncbi:MAG: hypothetical protein RIK87_23905 [Fuerstiella sp.]